MAHLPAFAAAYPEIFMAVGALVLLMIGVAWSVRLHAGEKTAAPAANGSIFQTSVGYTPLTSGARATSVTGAKSFTGSNGRLGNTCGLIACVATVPMRRV